LAKKKEWVLVTGATSGIGLATAILLALQGYQVIASGRTEEKLKKVEQAAEKAGTTIRRVLLDVTNPDSVTQMQKDVLALTDGYGVDVLVNNAGYAEAGAMEEIPVDVLRKQFETNVFGLVAVTQCFIPNMRSRRRGKIINISSVLGRVSLPLMGAYTATKHAVEAISDSLRMELSDTGIQVVVVAPGSIQTNFGETIANSIGGWVNELSPHRTRYEKFQKDRMSDRGAKPIVIAKTIQQAIESPKPRVRYAVPYDSKMMPLLAGLMPTRAMDSLMKKVILKD
jgi:short-subunit dehydrogenase